MIKKVEVPFYSKLGAPITLEGYQNWLLKKEQKDHLLLSTDPFGKNIVQCFMKHSDRNDFVS